jgi:hypothetical protein
MRGLLWPGLRRRGPGLGCGPQGAGVGGDGWEGTGRVRDRTPGGPAGLAPMGAEPSCGGIRQIFVRDPSGILFELNFGGA